jgi:hypothetical protein
MPLATVQQSQCVALGSDGDEKTQKSLGPYTQAARESKHMTRQLMHVRAGMPGFARTHRAHRELVCMPETHLVGDLDGVVENPGQREDLPGKHEMMVAQQNFWKLCRRSSPWPQRIEPRSRVIRNNFFLRSSQNTISGYDAQRSSAHAAGEKNLCDSYEGIRPCFCACLLCFCDAVHQKDEAVIVSHALKGKLTAIIFSLLISSCLLAPSPRILELLSLLAGMEVEDAPTCGKKTMSLPFSLRAENAQGFPHLLAS